MILMHVTYTLRPSALRENFCAALERQEILTRTRAEDGCQSYQLFYPVDRKDQVFLLEAWESAEKMAVHKRTAQCQDLQKLKAEYVEDPALRQFEV